MEIELQVGISLIPSDLECDDSEALQNVATCQIVMHNQVAKVCRSMPNTNELVVGVDAGAAIVVHRQSEYTKANQASKHGTETDGFKDQ